MTGPAADGRAEPWVEVRVIKLDSAAIGPDAAARPAAHALLRRLCAQYLGCSPEQVPLARRCVTCGATDHGQPRLEPAPPGAARYVSLSHCHPWAAVALGTVPVGVDVEVFRTGVAWKRLRPFVLHSDDEVPQDQRDWFRVWTCKEALAKMTGHGLTRPLARIHLSPPQPDGWRHTPDEPAHSRVRSLDHDRCAIAVAVATAVADTAVTVRAQWSAPPPDTPAVGRRALREESAR